ncbi:MAG: hypothetical protein GWN01_09460 [Nitrosopumilaceae archaeon]|nr:hypothetical protein [Nitrosopumilaceae archaeon]NIU87836.1 hypothetical protein [Nitrosopumilaceae archaeon]NIV65218.1 hypothetical protein [Nitrosopumilaceae archaeon]NIX61734.1 hypothetical protein [Nitrosopumilaceae archaeon]
MKKKRISKSYKDPTTKSITYYWKNHSIVIRSLIYYKDGRWRWKIIAHDNKEYLDNGSYPSQMEADQALRETIFSIG